VQHHVRPAVVAHDALLAAQAQHYDVVVVDINLPDKSGLELIKRLRAQGTKAAVVVLCAYPEEMYALRAFKQGAAAYLNKRSSADAIIAAVRKAAAGGRYVSPEVMERFAGMIGARRSAVTTPCRTANWRCSSTWLPAKAWCGSASCCT
jgi:DNA-binding NarL/FixJ family response regulator